MPGWLEISVVLLVIVLLFGATKLPDLARSLGRSMRIFKSEVSEMKKESATADPQKAPQEQLQQAPVSGQDPYVQQPGQAQAAPQAQHYPAQQGQPYPTQQQPVEQPTQQPYPRQQGTQSQN